MTLAKALQKLDSLKATLEQAKINLRLKTRFPGAHMHLPKTNQLSRKIRTTQRQLKDAQVRVNYYLGRSAPSRKQAIATHFIRLATQDAQLYKVLEQVWAAAEAAKPHTFAGTACPKLKK